jgi:putative hydrolase of the HAD superfamily
MTMATTIVIAALTSSPCCCQKLGSFIASADPAKLGGEMATRVVFLDALDTLVALEPPWVHLADALGIEVDERLVGAVRTEMTYYKEHAHEGRDAESLAGLRSYCAELISRELGREVSVETMMETIRFAPFEDSEPALRELRSMGLQTICVSNWDVSLGEVLEGCGLDGLLDGVVTSAAIGKRKPDPAVFQAALAIAGCDAADALHVGDSPEEDLAGAEAAGIDALLIDRDGGGDIASLLELPGLLGAAA